MPVGQSLHIGVSSVDPVFQGRYVPIPSAIADAASMQDIAQRVRFEPEILLTKDATAKAILDSISRSADCLQAGDIFFLSYSGHGTSVLRVGKKRENAWVAYDRLVGKKELHQALCRFRSGVRVVAISDCCHSEGIIPLKLLSFLRTVLGNSEAVSKAIPSAALQNVLKSHPELSPNIKVAQGRLKATVIAFSSSKSDANSIALQNHGLFTQKLLAVWDNGVFDGTYLDFYRAIKMTLVNLQLPEYKVTGPRDPTFEGQRPFTI